MCSGPLTAAVKAQALAAQASMNFIKKAGFDPDGSVTTVSLSFKGFNATTQQYIDRTMTIPLLAILPIPFVEVCDRHLLPLSFPSLVCLWPGGGVDHFFQRKDHKPEGKRQRWPGGSSRECVHTIRVTLRQRDKHQEVHELLKGGTGIQFKDLCEGHPTSNAQRDGTNHRVSGGWYPEQSAVRVTISSRYLPTAMLHFTSLTCHW